MVPRVAQVVEVESLRKPCLLHGRPPADVAPPVPPPWGRPSLPRKHSSVWPVCHALFEGGCVARPPARQARSPLGRRCS
jgi:hypothetical protein